MLADGQPKVRFGLRVLLERQPGLQIVGEAVDVEEMLACAQATCPGLLLLGWELPCLTSASLSALREVCPNLSIVALSGRPEARHEALAAGVDGFVSKTDLPERLLSVIAECGQKGKGNVHSGSPEHR
jgi:DNA-binding NarL/FixJ family response regulator